MSPLSAAGESLADELEGSDVGNLGFRPAMPWGWVIWAVRNYLRLDLAWRNRLRLERRDLQVLRDLPRGVGLILASNHADETDFKACLELSGRCNRRFLFMMNRQAFDEGHGTAGWWLQRLGVFSVDRGGQNERAKRFAVDVVKQGRAVLVIFPEGEIYYLNDLVQPFKSGVVDIGMQAVLEARRTDPDWTSYLVPMAIKYRYRQPIRPLLGAAHPADGAVSLSSQLRGLAPATIGSHRGGTLASTGAHSSSQARSGSHRRAERAHAGCASGGPLRDGGPLSPAHPRPPGPDHGPGLAAEFLPAEVAESG